MLGVHADEPAHARHAHVVVIAVAIPRTTRIVASSAPGPLSGLPSPRASIQSGRHAVRAVARASRAASPVLIATACGAGVVDICWFSLAGELIGRGGFRHPQTPRVRR